jgi:hypothetical protein
MVALERLDGNDPVHRLAQGREGNRARRLYGVPRGRRVAEAPQRGQGAQGRAAVSYVVTVHEHLPGVGLSLAGHWGNLRFPDTEAARLYAAEDAKKHNRPLVIERVVVKRKGRK